MGTNRYHQGERVLHLLVISSNRDWGLRQHRVVDAPRGRLKITRSVHLKDKVRRKALVDTSRCEPEQRAMDTSYQMVLIQPTMIWQAIKKRCGVLPDLTYQPWRSNVELLKAITRKSKRSWKKRCEVEAPCTTNTSKSAKKSCAKKPGTNSTQQTRSRWISRGKTRQTKFQVTTILLAQTCEVLFLINCRLIVSSDSIRSLQLKVEICY